MKYPREKMSHPQNTQEKKFSTHEITTKTQMIDDTRPTRPRIVCDPQNLAHSKNFK